jgi:hypothetical protein
VKYKVDWWKGWKMGTMAILVVDSCLRTRMDYHVIAAIFSCGLALGSCYT